MIYFDNAATSFPKSESVFAAIEKAYYGTANAGRSGHLLSLRASEILFECRESIARQFGARSENVILCPSATYALNTAIKGLFKAGEDNVTSFFEHNAVLRPLYSLEKFGCGLRFFLPDFESPQRTAERFRAVMSSKVRLVVLTHGSNVNGGIMPVSILAAEAKKAGAAVIVDCSQSAGHLKINVEELGADVLCFAGHKGLGGPTGTGIMVLSDKFGEEIKPLIEGGTGTASQEKEMPEFLPERLEAGTLNVMGFCGLAQAVSELELSIEKERVIQKKVLEGLKMIKGVKVYSEPRNYKNYLPLVLFNKSGFSSEEFAEWLSKFEICVRGGFHCAPLAHSVIGTREHGAVRVSLGRGNTLREAETFLDAVERV